MLPSKCVLEKMERISYGEDIHEPLEPYCPRKGDKKLSLPLIQEEARVVRLSTREYDTSWLH